MQIGAWRYRLERAGNPPTIAADAASGRQLSRSTALADWTALALTLLAAALRFYHLGDRPLWLDETTTARALRFHTLGEMLAWMHSTPDQMPIFNIITWMLGALGGTEWAVRLPSVVAGTLGIPALYLLGRTLCRPRVGLVAALVMAVLPFAVWYGQEGRPYALLMTLSTLQMLFAYRSIVYGRVRDWAGVVVVTVLNLYTHYDALFVTAAAFAWIGIALLAALAAALRRSHESPTQPALRRVLAQMGAALAAAILIGVTYIPWLPYIRDFENRPDLGFGQFVNNAAVTPAAVDGLLAQFNFTGALRALAALGLVTCVAWLGLQRWRQGTLLLAWLAVPLLGFWLRLHGGLVTVTPRYLSFLVPAAVLLAAIGVESIAEIAGWLGAALRERWTWALSALATAALALAILSQAGPALAQQYRLPKTDYRDAADAIIAGSPPGSVVLALSGACNYYIIGSLGYYFWRHHADILVVDGAQLDDRVAARLRRGMGRVWAAVITGSGNSGCDAPIDVARLPTATLDVRPFTEITVLRPRQARLTPTAQAEALLHWGSLFQPQLLSSADLLQIAAGHMRLGGNLLPSLGGAPAAAGDGPWVLAPDSNLTPDRSGFVLSPHHGAMIDVTVTSHRAQPGHRYVLRFSYRNGGFQGEQKVYVSAVDAKGRWLDIFPNGAGYSCVPAAAWTQGAFALTVPAGTTALTVWLRATGAGTAAFRAVTLRPIE